MLELNTVVKEMRDLVYDREHNFKSPLTKDQKKTLNGMRKRIQYLKVIRQYLETSPTESFIKKEIERVQNRISLIDACFSHSPLAKEDAIKAIKKEYEKENSIPHLRTQVRALKFILKN